MIFRPPLPRVSGFNNRISREITIDVRFSKTPPPSGKPDVLNGWLLNKEDDSALLRWEVRSPELARVILEFEDCLDKNEVPAESSTKHHEDNESFNQ